MIGVQFVDAYAHALSFVMYIDIYMSAWALSKHFIVIQYCFIVMDLLFVCVCVFWPMIMIRKLLISNPTTTTHRSAMRYKL